MVDTKIPQPDPGIAGFGSESFGGPAEPRFGDGIAQTTSISYVTLGALTLPIYSVVGFDGVTLILHDEAVGEPYGILTAPIDHAGVESGDVAIYRSGHWDMDVLNWHASYASREDKRTAFEGSNSPGILVSKKKHSADDIDA